MRVLNYLSWLAENEKKEKRPEKPYTIVDGSGQIVSQHWKKETAETRMSSLKEKTPEEGYHIVTDKDKLPPDPEKKKKKE